MTTIKAISLRPAFVDESGASSKALTASLLIPVTFLAHTFFRSIRDAACDKWRYETSLPPRYLRKALSEANRLLQVSGLHDRFSISQTSQSSMFATQKRSPLRLLELMPLSVSRKPIYKLSASLYAFNVCALLVFWEGTYSFRKR